MSESKNKAEKIVTYLESMTDRGFKRTFGALKRKEFGAIVTGLEAIIDGKEAEPYVVKVKEPKVKSEADKGTGGSGGKVTPGKATGGKVATA
jgi:hypothetical protein